MSSDDGILVRQNARGKWVAQHYFMSSDEYPDVNDPKLQEYLNLEDVIAAYREAAVNTEYGFNIHHSETVSQIGFVAQVRGLGEDAPSFGQELKSLLNRYSKENASGTPDFILARFLERQLWIFEETIQQRASWRGETTNLPSLENMKARG